MKTLPWGTIISMVGLSVTIGGSVIGVYNKIAVLSTQLQESNRRVEKLENWRDKKEDEIKEFLRRRSIERGR